jgi:outer membrane protein assembly factor BamA
MSQPRNRISLRWRSLIASGALAGATAFLPTGVHGQDVDPAFAEGAQVVVDSVIVQGNLLFTEGVLLGTIGLPPGASITYVDVQAAERRIWQTGAFRDIQVTVREGVTPLSATLTFWLEEHPVVRSYSIEGLTGIAERDVWEHADIRAREPTLPTG